jgi:xylulokinase
MKYTLGVDFGGSAVKATLLEETGRVHSSAEAEYSTFFPKDGWTEQDPEEQYHVFRGVIKNILEKSGVNPGDIAAVAISAASQTGVYLDKDDKVIRKSIHWTDLRGAKYSTEFKNTRYKFFFDKTTNPPSPTRTLIHLMWMRDHEPDNFRRIRKVMFVKDYIRYRLTGKFVTDYIDAMGSHLLDTLANAWDRELCGLAGLDPGVLPEILNPADILGPISPGAARELGLSENTQVVVGTTDTVMEVYANGAIKKGDMTNNLATAGRICSIADHPIDCPSIVNYRHVVPGLWYPGTGTRYCASSYRWYRDVLSEKEIEEGAKKNISAYALLDAEAAKIAPGSGNLLFHPYLQGENNNPHRRASFTGIRASHTKSHFSRALLEGVAYSMKESFNVMVGLGLKVSRPVLIGGGAKGPLWRQIMADCLGIEMVTSENSDSSLGSAMLAGVAAGVFSSFEDSAARCVKITGSVKPNPDTVKIYEKGFRFYKAITDALDTVYRDMDQE